MAGALLTTVFLKLSLAGLTVVGVSLLSPRGVRRLAAGLSVPVREIPYAGTVGIEPEVLAALNDSL